MGKEKCFSSFQNVDCHGTQNGCHRYENECKGLFQGLVKPLPASHRRIESAGEGSRKKKKVPLNQGKRAHKKAKTDVNVENEASVHVIRKGGNSHREKCKIEDYRKHENSQVIYDKNVDSADKEKKDPDSNDNVRKESIEDSGKHRLEAFSTEKASNTILDNFNNLDIEDFEMNADAKVSALNYEKMSHESEKKERERKSKLNFRKQGEKNLTEKKPEKKHRMYDEESNKKLVVKIPWEDNRLTEERERETGNQEDQTKVKTLRKLTMDAEEQKEKFKVSIENENEKLDLSSEKEGWPSDPYRIPCRVEVRDENCNSYLTENSTEQTGGVENSCHTGDESYENDLSYNSAEQSSSFHDKFETLGYTMEKDENLRNSTDEKVDTVFDAPALRVAELEEDDDITAEGTTEGQALSGESDIEELSEKEKISMASYDEKAECVTDYHDEQTMVENTADLLENQENLDVKASYPEDMGKEVRVKEVKAAGDEAENIEGDTEEKIENNALEENDKGPVLAIFEEDIAEIVDQDISEKTSVSFRYMILVLRDTILLHITSELRQCVVIVARPEEKRILGCCPMRPVLSRYCEQWCCQNTDKGQQTSRHCKGGRRKNAHVKRCKRDILAKEDSSRRLLWLQDGGCSGRRCSDGQGGAHGGGYRKDIGGSPEKGAGDNEPTERRDGNANGNKKNNDDDSFRDGGRGDFSRSGSGGDGRKDRKRHSQSDPEDDDSNVPDSDFKRYRKKHSAVSYDDYLAFLGGVTTIVEERRQPVWVLNDNPIGDCIASSLERPDEVSEELLECEVCSILNSLLKHYADCQEQYLACTMCMQIFSFICIHAFKCKTDQYECDIKLCKKFHQVLGDDTIPNRMKYLWFNIKKKLARVLGYDDGVMMSATHIPVNPPNLLSLGGPRGYSPSLESIPESGSSGSDGSSSRSGSRILARKRSNKLPSVQETESLPPDVPVHEPMGELADRCVIAAPVEQIQPSRETAQRKISTSRFTSLPAADYIAHGRQYPSFTDKPVGTPGICEVMYSGVRQLVVVSKNWNRLKAMHLREETLPRPYREEGIILRPYQEYLRIEGIRYQLEFQWLKVSHLGNGMSGKCHLATDFQSDFKFCVKEIHIRNFEEEEVELWGDLEHPYIVKLYGAIRHGEMIYIFSEFVDGGNLTEAINTQRALNRRLSHQTALTLFKQLLEVLVYLKGKHILHEDLKADNILLHREKDSISIKVADFGLATRANTAVRVGSKPVGTMTQWSPEKAECVGYGYPAEIWAAVCVLVHMVSGLPPWIRRYPGLKSLIVVIVQQSPPVEDIPRNIPKAVRDLIERGFTVCQGQRPTPEQLLKHEAFKLLTDRPPRNDAYSILDSVFHIDTELEDKNSDLQQIIKDLDQKRGKPVVSVAKDLGRIASGIQEQTGVTSGQVYMLPEVQYGVKPTTQNSASAENSGLLANTNEPSEGTSSENDNPLRYYTRFIQDDVAVANHPGNIVTPYQPDMRDYTEELEQSIQELELEDHALRTRLPHFEKILDSSSEPKLNDGNEASDEDDQDPPFDFKREIQRVQEKYLTPTDQVERNPMIPTLPLVIESLMTTPTETMPEFSIINSAVPIGSSPKTVSSTIPDEAKTEGTFGESKVSKSNVRSVPKFEDEQIPSGDELFASGPNESLTATMEKLSVGGKVSATSVQSNQVHLEATCEDDDLFGPQLSVKYETEDNKETGQPTVLPPMCVPSRNIQTEIRPVTRDIVHQKPAISESKNASAAHVSPVIQTLFNNTRYTLTPVSNTMTGQTPLAVRLPDHQPVNRVPGQLIPSSPSTLPHRQEYPYSFMEQATTGPPVDPTSVPVCQSSPILQRRDTVSPKSDSQGSSKFQRKEAETEPHFSKFKLGPPSSTSSSGSQGDFNLSPVLLPQVTGDSPYQPGMRNLQMGTDPQKGTPLELGMTPQLGSTSQMQRTTASSIQLGTGGLSQTGVATANPRYDRSISMASSAMTSTPVKIPRKGKQEKDAMNEMLRSYQATNGMKEGSPELELTQSQTAETEVHQKPHLNIPFQVMSTSPVHQVKSAPTLEWRPSYPSDHHRVSHTPQSATTFKGAQKWPTQSQMSTPSTSTRSQIEEQDRLFEELSRELETQSQNSRSRSESNLHLSLLDGDESNDTSDEYVDSFASEPNEAAQKAILKYITTTEEVPSGWTSWSPWSNCSSTCGVGIQNRYRSCLTPTGGYDQGDLCPGVTLETKECVMPDCPTTPNWTPWTPWSQCDVTCGDGTQTRYRECNDPPPMPGQTGCLGPANETVQCSMPPCECVFDTNAFTEIFNYQPAEIIGWVEKDGLQGPTIEAELVRVGDHVSEDVIIHVQCNNCTCTEGNFDCTSEQCENCTFTSWSEWTPCSKTCDVGQRSRERELLSGENLQTCNQTRREVEDCNTNNCPSEQQWSTWGEWSGCTSQIPCVPGSRTRTRDCPGDTDSCVGDAVETEPCGEPCSDEEATCTDGHVWSSCAFKCPQTCRDYRMETACVDLDLCLPGCSCPPGYVTTSDGSCIQQDQCPCYDENGNAILPGFSYSPTGKPCETCKCTANHTLECTTDPNCCDWDEWTPWGECSVTCGEGTRHRYRTLTSGSNCGDSSEEEPCVFGECPPDCVVDGVGYQYGQTISDDFCTTCYCTVESAYYCVNNSLADVDGQWSEWTEWSTCTSSCTGGVKQRTRACNDPLPQCNGLPCSGDSTEELPCNKNVTCCEVGPYGQWSECSVSCGEGLQTRTRSYVNDSMAAVCDVDLTDEKSCNFGECNISCVMTQWSDWSACSATCGTGTMFRSRGIINEAPDCPENSRLDSSPCYEQDCPCPDNKVWSNTSLCQRTCTERFGEFNDTLCTLESEGCVCVPGYYLDHFGDCVNTSQCDKCYVDGVEWLPGEVHDDTDDPCYSCQCVGGELVCDRKCIIPTCADNEILSYDVPNQCCPVCVPQEDTCRKYTRTEILRDDASNCVSVDEVEVDYCAGSCGNSTSSTILMLSVLDARQSERCACCTAITGDLVEVPVVCGPNQTPQTAYIAKISQCRCQSTVCINTESQVR